MLNSLYINITTETMQYENVDNSTSDVGMYLDLKTIDVNYIELVQFNKYTEEGIASGDTEGECRCQNVFTSNTDNQIDGTYDILTAENTTYYNTNLKGSKSSSAERKLFLVCSNCKRRNVACKSILSIFAVFFLIAIIVISLTQVPGFYFEDTDLIIPAYPREAIFYCCYKDILKGNYERDMQIDVPLGGSQGGLFNEPQVKLVDNEVWYITSDLLIKYNTEGLVVQKVLFDIKIAFLHLDRNGKEFVIIDKNNKSLYLLNEGGYIDSKVFTDASFQCISEHEKTLYVLSALGSPHTTVHVFQKNGKNQWLNVRIVKIPPTGLPTGLLVTDNGVCILAMFGKKYYVNLYDFDGKPLKTSKEIQTKGVGFSKLYGTDTEKSTLILENLRRRLIVLPSSWDQPLNVTIDLYKPLASIQNIAVDPKDYSVWFLVTVTTENSYAQLLKYIQTVNIQSLI